MAYTDTFDAATTEGSVLRKQVAVALVKAAQDIVNDTVDPPANQPARLNLARAIREQGGPTRWADTFIWRVLENASIAAAPTTSTDNDVQFVVNSLIDDFAF